MAKREGQDGDGRAPDSYAVGYGRPPVGHRFRAGEPSRNPHGRRGKPRPAVSPEAEPDFLDDLVTIVVDGERRQVTREGAIDYALYMTALKGSVPAARELEARRNLREQRRTTLARGLAVQVDVPVSVEDEVLIASALRRAGRYEPQGDPEQSAKAGSVGDGRDGDA